MELQTVCWGSTLPLRHSDQQLGESTRSKLHDLDMRIQGSQMKLPRRVVIQCQVASQGKHNMNITKDIKFRKQGLEHKYRRLSLIHI